MPDQTNLPTEAELEALKTNIGAGQATAPAKAAHDAVLGDLTKAAPEKPDLTPGPDTDAAIAYVEAKGYSHRTAIEIVQEKGVDVILAAKAHDDSAQRGPTPGAAPQVRQPEAGPTAEQQEILSRHGEPFNPEIHAQLPTGDPATDSTGRFISKENHYRGPRPNSQFPD
jgi:hypothetical protein